MYELPHKEFKIVILKKFGAHQKTQTTKQYQEK